MNDNEVLRLKSVYPKTYGLLLEAWNVELIQPNDEQRRYPVNDLLEKLNNENFSNKIALKLSTIACSQARMES